MRYVAPLRACAYCLMDESWCYWAQVPSVCCFGLRLQLEPLPKALVPRVLAYPASGGLCWALLTLRVVVVVVTVEQLQSYAQIAIGLAL